MAITAAFDVAHEAQRHGFNSLKTKA